MEKIYRIFISSCKRLLERERQILSEVILMSNHLPVQMEYSFQGVNKEYSIEIDKRKLQEADCVIFILSYLYGEIIGEKIGNKDECPLRENPCKNCDSCFDPKECMLSFTQFEYEYAKLLNKPIFVIYNKNYNCDKEFSEANRKYQEKYSENDCQSAYYESKRKNNFFVSNVIGKHAYPYINKEDFYTSCFSAVKSAEDILSKLEDDGNGNQGLIPYTNYCEIKKKYKKMEQILSELQKDGIEKIYQTQSIALEELAQEKDIYLGLNGEIQDICILAIRGSSFTGGMGHEWTRFVLDEEFKLGMTINIEFVLADYRNEKLIEERYTAFQSSRPSKKELEKYKKEYTQDMKRAQAKINQYRKDNPCILYLHNEAKLPFRMVFIGKYLYLSTFLNYVKAANAPVMKIPATSTLYKVCKEYYEWIRDNAERQV